MWTKELFGVEKPIIALLHLRPLPGDPLFKDGDTIDSVVNQAREELIALQNGGVDGVLIANEFSLPYEKHVSQVALASMGYVVGALKKDLSIPFGVNVVTNPMASVDLAAATGASFVRSAFTGAYIGEDGIVDTDIASVMRRKKYLGREDLKLLFKVNPESSVYLAERPIEKITKSIIFHCFPDALCVSGAAAGSETDSSLIERVKAVAGDTPTFANTGCTTANIKQMLAVSDGACVGSTFKKDGKFANPVDEARVKEFMAKVFEYRAENK